VQVCIYAQYLHAASYNPLSDRPTSVLEELLHLPPLRQRQGAPDGVGALPWLTFWWLDAATVRWTGM